MNIVEKKNVFIKGLILLIIAIIVISYFGYRSIQKDLAIEYDARQELINDVKKEKQTLIDSLSKVKLKEIESLKKNISRLSNYSNGLVQKLKSYEKNPDYDIDFMSSVDVITRSDYQGRNVDDDPKQND